MWISRGVRHSAEVHENSLLVPLLFPESQKMAAVGDSARMSFHDGWRDRLLLCYCAGLSYLSDTSPRLRTVGMILDAAPGNTAPTLPHPPVLPHSREACETARLLLTNPGSRKSLEDFSRQTCVSPRTLSRQFSSETGLTFSEWRSEARMACSARMLLEGRPVAWTAATTGFDTHAGFTRAFRRSVGMTPSQFISHAAGGGREPEPFFLDAPGSDRLNGEPPSALPPSRTWPRINGFSVAVWVYRGSATVTLGDRRLPLTRGDALCIPSGVFNVIDIDADSLVIPLFTETDSPFPADLDSVTPVHLPGELLAFLLHTSVSSYTLLGGLGSRNGFVADMIRPGKDAHNRACGGDAATSAVHHAMHHHLRVPGDSATLSDWSALTGISTSALSRTWTKVTGQNFRTWRSHLRMSAARELLSSGRPVSEVSRLLGYSDRAGFTKAFTGFFGTGPGSYRRNVTDGPADRRSAAGASGAT